MSEKFSSDLAALCKDVEIGCSRPMASSDLRKRYKAGITVFSLVCPNAFKNWKALKCGMAIAASCISGSQPRTVTIAINVFQILLQSCTRSLERKSVQLVMQAQIVESSVPCSLALETSAIYLFCTLFSSNRFWKRSLHAILSGL